MKKKILALLLMVTLAASITACGGTTSGNKVSDDVETDVDEDKEEAKSEGVLVFDAPESLVYDEANNQYVSTEEGVLSNINYITEPNDGSLATTTKEIMEASLEPSLSDMYGTTIDLEITKWDSIEVDGYDAISYQMEYDYSGMKVIQAQVIVDGTEKLHFVTFTYLEHEDFADDVAACIESFRFE